jgi:hypothetical protein
MFQFQTGKGEGLPDFYRTIFGIQTDTQICGGRGPEIIPTPHPRKRRDRQRKGQKKEQSFQNLPFT